MSVFQGFVGPSNQNRSPTVDCEQTVNWYVEPVQAGTPKASPVLPPTPGCHLYVSLYAGPVRALFAQNGRCFAIGGTVLHEIFPSQTLAIRGTVATDGNPATISTNGTGGNQLLITSGGQRYVYDLTADTLTLIDDGVITSPVVSGAFYQGYGLVLDTDGAVWFSALEDVTSWNGLDFFLESQVSDTTVQMTVTHDNIYLYGTEHVAPWVNTGAADVPFQPVPGSIMQVGTGAPWSAANIFNTAIWVGRNSDGASMVYMADGYQPKRISTFAVEDALSRVSGDQLSQSIGFTYQMRGHTFYVLQVPGLLTTWVYDLLAQAWHERALWSTTAEDWRPWVARTHQYAFGRHLVGDRRGRGLYEMRDDFTFDQVTPALLTL